MAELVSSSLYSLYSVYTQLAQFNLDPSSTAVQHIMYCVLYSQTGSSTWLKTNTIYLGQVNETSAIFKRRKELNCGMLTGRLSSGKLGL